MSLPDLEITAALTTQHQDARPVPGDPDPAPEGVARPEELAIPALTISTPERQPRRNPERVSVGDAGSTRDRKVRRGRGQPDADEWQKFFEEYALDWLMSGYMALEFRGINRRDFPEEFWDELEASEEDISDIAGALSDLVHGTSVSKKHGRKIINSAAALDAAHCLTLWGWRVHKQAMQIRRDRGMIQPRQPRQRRQRNERETRNVANSQAPAQEQSANGHAGGGLPFQVYSPNGG